MKQLKYTDAQFAPSGRSDIVVAEAIPEDAADISRIRKDGWLSTYANTAFGITVEDILTKDFDSPAIIAHRAELIRTQHGKKVWVARINSVVIGFAIATERELQNDVGALYVLSGYRRIGVGGQLLDRALSWLGSKKDVTLEVVSYNENAIRFYERYGFQRIIAPPKFKQSFPDGKPLPWIEMRLAANFGVNTYVQS